MRKRWNYRIFISMAIVCMMISVISLMADNFTYSIQESRKDAYGEWQLWVEDASDSVQAYLDSYPLLEKKGKMYTLGEHIDEAGKSVTVGVMDSSTFDMSRIALYEGRMPEAEGEVAICNSVRMNLFPEASLGDSIFININGTESYQGGEMTLVGILPDYRVSWNMTYDRRLPDIFIHCIPAGWSEYAASVFLESDQPLDSLENALKQREAFPDGSKISLSRNLAAYPRKGEDSGLETIHRIQYGIAILSICCMVIMESDVIRKKDKKWQILFSLGAERNQILRLITGELVWESLSAVPVGILLSLAVTWLLTGWLSSAGDETFVFQVNSVHLLWTILISIGCFLIALVIASLRSLLRVEAMVRNQKPRKGNLANRKKNKRKMTYRTMDFLVAGWKLYPARWIFMLILFQALFLIPVFCGFELYKATNVYKYYDRDNHGTYSCGFTEEGPLMRETIEELSGIYGVKKVIPYRYSSILSEIPFYGDLSAYSDSDYMRMLMDFEERHSIRAPKNVLPGASQVHPMTVVGVEDWDEAQRFVDALDMNALDKDAFLRGEQVIMVLPLQGESEGVISTSITGGSIKGDRELFDTCTRESLVAVGDIIRISRGGVEQEVEIGGVLHEMKEQLYVPICDDAYGIVASNRFFEGFAKEGEELGYRHLVIQTNGRENYEITDKMISKILGRSTKGDIFFTNHREEKTAIRKDTIHAYMIYLSLGGLCILLLSLVERMFAKQDEELLDEKLTILHCLGMSSGMKQWMRLLANEWMILLIVLVDYIVLRLILWNETNNAYTIGLPLHIYWGWGAILIMGIAVHTWRSRSVNSVEG